MIIVEFQDLCIVHIRTETLLNAEIKDLVELFEGHDQVFILKQDEVYKLHITKENVHKLFLN